MSVQYRRLAARISVALLASLTASAARAQSGEVNVYTYREAKLVQPLIDAFAKETGIKVNMISAAAGLEQRIAAGGAHNPAAVLLTGDISPPPDSVKARIRQPIKAHVLGRTLARP